MINSLEWPADSANEKARFFLACMQYLFVNIQLSKSPTLSNNLQQFQWSQVRFGENTSTETTFFFDLCLHKTNEFLTEIVDSVSNIINVGHMLIIERLNLSMELAEIIAEFSDQENLPDSVSFFDNLKVNFNCI